MQIACGRREGKWSAFLFSNVEISYFGSVFFVPRFLLRFLLLSYFLLQTTLSDYILLFIHFANVHTCVCVCVCARHATPNRNKHLQCDFSYLFFSSFLSSFHFFFQRTNQRKIKRQSGFTVNFYDHIALKKKNNELSFFSLFSQMLALIRWFCFAFERIPKKKKK